MQQHAAASGGETAAFAQGASASATAEVEPDGPGDANVVITDSAAIADEDVAMAGEEGEEEAPEHDANVD